MREYYVRKGKPNPIPDAYDTDTKLIIYYGLIESPIAFGQWTKNGFLLKRGSLLFDLDKSEEPGIKGIRNRLNENSLLDYNDGCGDYTLLKDIYLWSPSTAGRLVLGRNSDGY